MDSTSIQNARSIERCITSKTRLTKFMVCCVDRRLKQKDSKRVDLLARLIEAKDPQTGEMLEVIDIQTEAFGMVVAGTHTTATTMTLLLFHLLHLPRALEKSTEELVALDPGERISSMEGLADNVYFQACIKENLRYTPVFVMPLPRIVPEGGREIAGEEIPAGTTVYC
jgi:cytochrome P450